MPRKGHQLTGKKGCLDEKAETRGRKHRDAKNKKKGPAKPDRGGKKFSNCNSKERGHLE